MFVSPCGRGAPIWATKDLRNGIRAKVSSYTRHHVNVMMTKSKTAGNYVNSVLAKAEVKKGGYDEAIMLDTEGYVSEASGENIFIVRDGRIKTTPLTSILPGITRDSIITLARNKSYDVVEERFARDELYIADEAFFTGTAAELTPIREVDDRQIGAGCRGPVTEDTSENFLRCHQRQRPQVQEVANLSCRSFGAGNFSLNFPGQIV